MLTAIPHIGKEVEEAREEVFQKILWPLFLQMAEEALQAEAD
jgi:hypothetical protein